LIAENIMSPTGQPGVRPRQRPSPSGARPAPSAQRRAPRQAGFTLFELLVVVGIISAILAISVPMLMRARMAANEAAAIGSLRSVSSAEAGYSGAAAPGGYAILLATLATPCPGSSVGFISPDLSIDPSTRNGYIITLAPGTGVPGPDDCNGNATLTGYYSTAAPISAGRTGHRAFASTHRAVLFVDPTGVPPTNAQMAPGGGGTPLQ
jgi:prepilin-type N-terminal cleavage/methylation domain-containing protein